jgi:hypothetical protein
MSNAAKLPVEGKYLEGSGGITRMLAKKKSLALFDSFFTPVIRSTVLCAK